MTNIDKIKNKYIEILGGITGRITVLASIFKHGLNTNYNLVWNYQSQGYYAKFNDLFKNNYGFIDKETLDFTKFKMQTFGSPPCIHKFNDYLVPKNIDIETIKNGYFSFLDDYDYIFMDWPFLMSEAPDFNLFSSFMKELIIQDDIANEINNYHIQFDDNTIGIYYRGCEHNININMQSNNNINECLDKSFRLIESNTQNKIFIATGSNIFYDEIIKRDYKNLIIVDKNEYPIDCGDSIIGTKRGLIDFILLSKVKHAYINGGSGFALKACNYGNINYSYL